MPQYLYRLQPTRLAMLTDGPSEAEATAIGAHFAYLQALLAAGGLILAGRTMNSDATTFGVAIFYAPDLPSAEATMAGDPAVAAGVMSAELFAFHTALVSEANATPRVTGPPSG